MENTRIEHGENKYNVQPIKYGNTIYRFFYQSLQTLLVTVIAIIGAIQQGKSISANIKKLVNVLHIVHHTNNKLEGIDSISSSVLDNVFCQCRRMIKECICSHCYAHNQQKIQYGLAEHNIINGLILRNVLIPEKLLKVLPFTSKYIRIESFGDVSNLIQARNYIRIIKAFPRKRCAIWSKNTAIYARAFSLEGKPENTTYIHSSSYLNNPENEVFEKYNFIDHVFTVYEKKYAIENNIAINCGGKKCMKCIKEKTNCFYRNDVKFINELQK